MAKAVIYCAAVAVTCVLILKLTSTAAASGQEQNINSLVDSLIPEMVKIIENENLEPLWLSNLDQEELSHCRLHGLTSVYRSGDCLYAKLNDQKMAIYAHIGFQNLTGSCFIHKRVLIFRYRGVIRMRMSNVSSSIVIQQNAGHLFSNNSQPRLHSLDVELQNGLGMETEGDSALTFVLDTLKFVYIRRLERLIRDNLRNQFTNSLNHHLSMINSWEDVHPSIANYSTF
ncbi:hypothetical protein CHUAL_000163 [Chamberlinius hualienensis]